MLLFAGDVVGRLGERLIGGANLVMLVLVRLHRLPGSAASSGGDAIALRRRSLSAGPFANS